MSDIPDGPWCWYGSPHALYLATDYGGRHIIMSFARMGPQSAQPCFQVDRRMVKAADLVKFEVGDGKATGFREGKADETVYRFDVSGIDHPVARAMVAIPDLLAACKAARHELSRVQSLLGHEEDHDSIEAVIGEIDAATAAAEAEQP